MVLAIEQIRVDLEVAAYLAGLSLNTAKNITLREKLFADGERPGRGKPWLIGIDNVSRLATVRALVNDAGLSLTRAVEAVRPYGIYGALLADRPFVLTKNADGRWIAAQGGPSRVELHILPWMIWDEMRPRWAARYPSETAQFEAALAARRGE